jgi:ABC-2 type transport system permease protein
MRVLLVARREYLERVRSKAFVVSTILGPFIMAAFTLGPGLLMARQRGKPLRLSVLDASGNLQQDVERALSRRKVAGQERFLLQPPPAGDFQHAEAGLKDQVLKGDLDGYLLLARDALERSVAEYYGKNVSNVMDIGLLDKAVEEAFVARRLSSEGLPPEKIGHLTRKLELKTSRLTEKGAREDRGGTFFLSLILLTMLYATLAMWGAALMNGVLEEKNNRVVEVMVSSISPTQLFAGKLLGVGGAGLTQFLVWAGSLGLFTAYGASATAASGLAMPEVNPLVLAALVVYFLLGYFLYGSMYMALGAAVNTQQEAQSLAFPVMMPLLLGFVFSFTVLASPDSPLSVTLSLIPFFTPLLMFMRITTVTPPAWQIALSIEIMALTIVAMNWLAARIYRVGILMYGKRPTLSEIMRWVRQV